VKPDPPGCTRYASCFYDTKHVLLREAKQKISVLYDWQVSAVCTEVVLNVDCFKMLGLLSADQALQATTGAGKLGWSKPLLGGYLLVNIPASIGSGFF
jgi:hypothetical protein